jgi:hypothetical protein
MFVRSLNSPSSPWIPVFSAHIVLTNTVSTVRERKTPSRYAVPPNPLPVTMKIKAKTIGSYYLRMKPESVLINLLPSDSCCDRLRCGKEAFALFCRESIGRSGHVRHIMALRIRDVKG